MGKQNKIRNKKKHGDNKKYFCTKPRIAPQLNRALKRKHSTSANNKNKNWKIYKKHWRWGDNRPRFQIPPINFQVQMCFILVF